jgi:Uma2 family endonuclease
MDAVTATARMTVEEFLARPLDPASRRWELIDGELVTSQPQWAHNDSQGCIYAALRQWVNGAGGRGAVGLPLDVKLDERNVYAPDVVWYGDDRAPVRGDRAPFPVPDVAVEVRSPSTWRYDIGVKKANYERYGVAELWLIDTAADVVLVFGRSAPAVPRFDVSVELHVGETLTSLLLPGFSLAIGEIFAADA